MTNAPLSTQRGCLISAIFAVALVLAICWLLIVPPGHYEEKPCTLAPEVQAQRCSYELRRGCEIQSGLGLQCEVHCDWLTFDDPQLQGLVEKALPDMPKMMKEMDADCRAHFKDRLFAALCKGRSFEDSRQWECRWTLGACASDAGCAKGTLLSTKLNRYLWQKTSSTGATSFDRQSYAATFVREAPDKPWRQLLPSELASSPEAAQKLWTAYRNAFLPDATMIMPEKAAWEDADLAIHLTDSQLEILWPGNKIYPHHSGGQVSQYLEWKDVKDFVRPQWLPTEPVP